MKRLVFILFLIISIKSISQNKLNAPYFNPIRPISKSTKTETNKTEQNTSIASNTTVSSGNSNVQQTKVLSSQNTSVSSSATNSVSSHNKSPENTNVTGNQNSLITPVTTKSVTPVSNTSNTLAATTNTSGASTKHFSADTKTTASQNSSSLSSVNAKQSGSVVNQNFSDPLPETQVKNSSTLNPTPDITSKPKQENSEKVNASKNLSPATQASVSPELEQLVDKIIHPVNTFTFSGFIDAYYFKNLNDPKNSSNCGLSGMARAFDQKENQFQIGMAQTKFNWTKSKADAVIDLAFGPHADLASYGNRIGPFGVNVGSSALCIKQANISYKPNGKTTITMGQFGTHIGYEVIESSLNYHYSLSNQFNNGPFYHIGLKLSHNFNDQFSAMVGVVNNWDNLYDNNRFKTGIAQLSFTPKTGYSFYLNYIGGKEDDILDSSLLYNYYEKQSVTSFKQLLDFVANMQITKRFYVGINSSFGAKDNQLVSGDTTFQKRKVKTWGGIALYTKYELSPKLSFGIRAEFFDNSGGVQYIGKTDVQSYTATFALKLDDDLFLKPEVRMDIYKYNRNSNGVINDQQFMDKTGNYTKNSQTTIGAALIFKF